MRLPRTRWPAAWRPVVVVSATATLSSCTLLVDTSGLDSSGPLLDATINGNPNADAAGVADARPEDDATDAALNVSDVGGPVEPCPSTDPTLKLCVRFEGVVMDESAQGVAPIVADNVTFLPGVRGLAARFTLMPTTNVTIAYDTRLAGVRTIELWIKPATFTSATIVDVHDDLSLLIGADGSLRCRQPELTASVPLPQDEWSHVACALDGTSLHAYVNGKPAGTLSSTNVVDNVKYTGIGQDSPTGGSRYDGLLDELRIWSVTRSPEQIAAAARH